MSHFNTYLYGQDVTVYTDHAAVKAVLQNPAASGRQARWWIKVHGSGVKSVNIICRAGKDNVIADALSRNPQGPAPGGLAGTEIQVANVRSAPEERDSDISTLLQLEPEASPIQQSTLADEQRRDDNLLPMIKYLEGEGRVTGGSTDVQEESRTV